MTKAPPARVITGHAASPGFAAGPIYRLDGPTHEFANMAEAYRRSWSTERETERLALALTAAQDDLEALVARLDDPEAQGILEFQIAFLGDEELAQPAFDDILGGSDADEAWRDRLDEVIAEYTASDDPTFAARAADLIDLRDRVLRHLGGFETTDRTLPDGAIALAGDLAPSRFLAIVWKPGHALVLEQGSASSHVAILARARGLPLLVGCGEVAATEGEPALVDAVAGRITLSPDAAAVADQTARAAAWGADESLAAARAHDPAVTADGRRIAVLINVSDPSDLDGLDPAICDGIGLTRSEFLFHGRSGLPDEETQLAAYARILAWAGGRRVVIRTLDAGGDKPIPGLTLDGEGHPFLGLRGVRLSLARPEVFRVQIRALLRAAALAPLDVMVPMVTIRKEMAAVRDLFEEEARALAAAHVAHAMPRLGMMIEVPAAALTLDRFPVDFASIGSNDLTQYVTAAGRDAPAVASLADPGSVAMLRLYAEIVRVARSLDLPLSLCGDVGGDPARIASLIGAGITSLSMTPTAVARAKAAIRAIGAPR